MKKKSVNPGLIAIRLACCLMKTKIASFWTVKDVHMNLNSSVDKILRRDRPLEAKFEA